MLNSIVWITAISCTVLAQLLLKRGVQTLGDINASASGALSIVLEIFRNAYLFGGLLFFGISLILWIWLVSKMQLNILYPITLSAEVTLVAIGAWFWFSEVLTPIQIAGMGVIVVGIFLLSYTG